MRIENKQLTLDGTDLTSTVLSNPIWLAHIANYSVQITCTGTPNGTFKLQGSNDFGAKDNQPANASITNWADLSISQAVTASGSYMLEDADCGYRWVRLVWTDSSSGGGSAVSSARYNVKGF